MLLNKFSVIMSIYYKDDIKLFENCLISLQKQSLKADEVVIVLDGPVLKAFIELIERYKDILNIIVIPKNINEGLALALNDALVHTKNDLIIRMDSDDYSLVTRFEYLIQYFEKNPKVDIVGSWIYEKFNSHFYLKKYPIYNKQIVKNSYLSNPIAHPSVAFRKSSLIKTGNYNNVYLSEDYDLWLRAIKVGLVLANIPIPLLIMNINKKTFLRRRGLKYFKTQMGLYLNYHPINLFNFHLFVIFLSKNLLYRLLLPPTLMKILYFYKKERLNINEN
jgi:cellulose synthase/poly-beta-1,6-N-acetylglucosamine synthase-like glycosyltransferase